MGVIGLIDKNEETFLYLCDMIATLPYIEERFDHFNLLCFEGKLERPRMMLSRSRTCLGQLTYKRKSVLLRKTEYYDFVIRISRLYNLEERVLEDIILHEMIHYYIATQRLKDTSAHGMLFRQLMNQLNERYDRHITISHRSTQEEREKMASTRRRWHYVAMVTFHDGRFGIKVLPHNDVRARYYTRMVSRLGEVAKVELYASDNPFFNSYPCSSALKVHFADQEKVRAALGL